MAQKTMPEILIEYIKETGKLADNMEQIEKRLKAADMLGVYSENHAKQEFKLLCLTAALRWRNEKANLKTGLYIMTREDAEKAAEILREKFEERMFFNEDEEI